jgi:hypothetical protein
VSPGQADKLGGAGDESNANKTLSSPSQPKAGSDTAASDTRPNGEAPSADRPSANAVSHSNETRHDNPTTPGRSLKDGDHGSTKKPSASPSESTGNEERKPPSELLSDSHATVTTNNNANAATVVGPISTPNSDGNNPEDPQSNESISDTPSQVIGSSSGENAASETPSAVDAQDLNVASMDSADTTLADLASGDESAKIANDDAPAKATTTDPSNDNIAKGTEFLAASLESALAEMLPVHGGLLTNLLPFNLVDIELAIENLMDQIGNLNWDLNDPNTRKVLSWALIAAAAAILSCDVVRRQAKLNRETYYWDPHLGWINAPR